ncbi:MAG: nucleotidyltransferase domain-containing protein [bacterium]
MKAQQIARTNDIVREFKAEIGKLYGERLKDVILYGSWARNEGTEDSDIDLAVILKGQIQPGREIDRMIDIITDLNLKYTVLIAVYPVSEEDYLSVKSPLLMNIRKEGFVV